MPPLLSVRNLSIRYKGRDEVVHAVDDVSFDVGRGQVLALVGESGSGKSSVGQAMLGLLSPGGEFLDGEVVFDGEDVLSMSGKRLQTLRGRQISMIFQDPVAGLNPVIKISDQVGEMLQHHLRLKKKEARAQALWILEQMGLPDPERVANSYPSQLSGGMCQRVMIGIATSLQPQVLVADEPTSALDVTVQAQILWFMEELRRKQGTTIVLITHDFGVVSQAADEVAVMYGGRLMERGTVDEVLRSPLHPYSHALLAALPRLDVAQDELPMIPGHPPEFEAPPEHCPFLPRCSKAVTECREARPPALSRLGEGGHAVACYNPVWRG